MRKILCLLCLGLQLTVSAQSSDPVFNNRLKEYLRLNKELRFDEVMNYTHPVLFTITPRENIIAAFRQAFENQFVRMVIDTIITTGISPDFPLKEAVYRKVDYRMKMRLTLLDTAVSSSAEAISMMTTNLESSFPKGTIVFNKAANCFFIEAPTLLFAIRDRPGAEWMFLGYQKNEKLLQTIYPQEVISHFHLIE